MSLQMLLDALIQIKRRVHRSTEALRALACHAERLKSD
jgi:hypothetical protein